MATKNESRDSYSNEAENQSKKHMGENTSNDIKEVAATVKKIFTKLESSFPKRDAYVIEIPEDLESSFKDEDFSSAVCIFRVPRKLRAINPTAYTPQLMLIGPFHHNSTPLKDMEEQKLRYLAEFCIRTRIHWKELLQQIKEKEPRIRRCYDHAFELHDTENAFARMILLDSVFIIEFFLRRGENSLRRGLDEKNKTDYLLGKSSRERATLEDLILLENQLPYFVLEDLYEFATKNSGLDLSEFAKNSGLYSSEFATKNFGFFSLVLWNLKGNLNPPEVEDHQKFISCDFFSCFYGYWVTKWFSRQKKTDDGNTEEKEIKDNEKPKHFTDLARKSRSHKHPVSKEDIVVKVFTVLLNCMRQESNLR